MSREPNSEVVFESAVLSWSPTDLAACDQSFLRRLQLLLGFDILSFPEVWLLIKRTLK